MTLDFAVIRVGGIDRDGQAEFMLRRTDGEVFVWKFNLVRAALQCGATIATFQ